jgi:hypothetical protein
VGGVSGDHRVYAAFFLGQGGYLFSLGVPRLAARARAIGIETDVYRYTEADRARLNLSAKHATGRKIALVGYSLGCTTTTWLQTQMRVDLLCAIAESSLAQNHPISKANTRRSVLWAGPGFLSDAGTTSGFDQVHAVEAPHLWMDFSPRVTDGVLAELATLKKEP